jgi:hypothetical protein
MWLLSMSSISCSDPLSLMNVPPHSHATPASCLLPLRLPLLLPPPLPIPREGWLLTLQSARGPPNRLLIFFSLKNIVSLPLGRVLWGMSGESGWNSDSCSEPTSSSRTEMLACHFWMLQSRRTAWDCCQLPRSGCPTPAALLWFSKESVSVNSLTYHCPRKCLKCWSESCPCFSVCQGATVKGCICVPPGMWPIIYLTRTWSLEF